MLDTYTSIYNLSSIALPKSQRPILCGIYRITSPSGKVYIGQSINIIKRWWQHKRSNTNKQPKLYSSFKKYGIEAHIFEIKEECRIEILNERERHWEDFYEVISINGLNCRLTETNDKKGIIGYETRKRLSESHKGKKPSEESKLKRKLNTPSKVGENNPMYGIKGVDNPNYGSKRTDEFKEKASKRHTGSGKVIAQIDKITKELIREATINVYKDDGFESGSIWKCCENELCKYSHKNYYWQYV